MASMESQDEQLFAQARKRLAVHGVTTGSWPPSESVSIAIYDMAETLHEWGELDLAMTFYRRAFELGVTEGALNLSALLRVHAREPTEAMALAKQVAEAGDGRGYVAWGDAELSLGKLDRAAALFARAAEMGEALGVERRGTVYEQSGDVQSALEWYRRAGEMGLARGWTLFGWLHWRLGGVEEGREGLSRGAEQGDEEAFPALGELEAEAGNREAAEKWFGKAQAVHPCLGAVQFANFLSDDPDRWTEAEAVYRRALECGDEDARHNLGVRLLDLPSRRSEGVELISEAADRGDPLALRALERIEK